MQELGELENYNMIKRVTLYSLTKWQGNFIPCMEEKKNNKNN